MGKYEKLLHRILSGTSDRNIKFDDLCNLMKRLGFEKRTSGSHHIFYKAGIKELINLQRDGDKAKAYQIRSVRNIIEKYNLSGNLDA